MATQNAGSGGTLFIINWLSRTSAAIKFWAIPVLLGTKLVGIITVIYYIFFTGKSGNGLDFCRYYGHIFILYLSEKYSNSGTAIYAWLDNYVRPEKFISALSDGDPKATAEALWIAKTAHNSLLTLEVCTAMAFIGAFAAWYISKRVYESQTADKYIRGTIKTTAKKLNKMLRKELGKGNIEIGSGFFNRIRRNVITIPSPLEPQSMLLLGKAGQGKTIILNSTLKTVLDRGDKACVLCLKDGDFISTHADLNRDKIYCPGDVRSLQWSFMEDICSLSDFDMIGNIFFPPKPGASGPWQDGAREIFVGLLKYAYVTGQKSTKAIYNDIFSNPAGARAWRDYLLKAPDGNKAAGMLALPDSPTAFGFYITVLVGIKPLQIMAKNDGNFSIRKYMADPNAGSLFLISKSKFKAMLAPAQSLFLEMLMINHLDMGQDLKRRFHYFLDELPNLNKINKLDELLAVARSLGSCVYIGSQSYVQLNQTYTEDTRKSMCNNLNTKILFCIADPATSTESSDVIGKAEYEISRQTISTSGNEVKDSISAMSELKERTVVMPSELSNLKMKELYIFIPGFGVAKTKIKYVKYAKINEAFVPDPDYDIATIQKEYDELNNKVSNFIASVAELEANQKAEVVQKSAQQEIAENDDFRYQQQAALTLSLVDDDDNGGLTMF